MVPTLSMNLIGVSMIISALIPIGFFIFFYRKFKISYKVAFTGMIIWIIFSQILEKGFHLLVFSYTPLLQTPILFALYAALAAGVFEEVGRFFAFRYLLKNNHQWEDGVAYGIGHGGIEAIFIGVFVSFQLLSFAVLLNAGQIDQFGGVSQGVVDSVRKVFENPSIYFLLIGIERGAAFILQIAWSLIVLYAIVRRQIKFLFVAIGLHALVDLAPALYQAGLVNIWVTEALVLISAVVAG
jgi:uncharacterized membrane protein YhfC